MASRLRDWIRRTGAAIGVWFTAKPPAPDPPRTVAVREAELLLTFATRRGIPIDDEVIDTIITARNTIAAAPDAPWPQDFELKFWKCSNLMARKVSPISVASLKATSDFYGAGSNQARLAVARRRSEIYRALTALLVAQIYWLIGARVSSDIDLVSPKLQQVHYEIRASRKQGDLTVERQNDLDRKVGENAILESRINSEMGILGVWSAIAPSSAWIEHIRDAAYWVMLWHYGALSSPTSPQPDRNLIRQLDAAPESNVIENSQAVRVKTGVILEVLRLYVLPLLYGLLGASVYVLRNLAREIDTLVYTRESEIRFRLRVILGTLSGLAAAWFIHPPTASPQQLSVDDASALPPLALAFLAGYSVEVLFSAMDRFINAFSVPQRGRRASDVDRGEADSPPGTGGNAAAFRDASRPQQLTKPAGGVAAGVVSTEAAPAVV
jgi:hypothetical protein